MRFRSHEAPREPFSCGLNSNVHQRLFQRMETRALAVVLHRPAASLGEKVLMEAGRPGPGFSIQSLDKAGRGLCGLFPQ